MFNYTEMQYIIRRSIDLVNCRCYALHGLDKDKLTYLPVNSNL